MLATGLALAGDTTEATQRAARRWLADGPARWTPEQWQYRRYALTDALDDLFGASGDPDERDAVAGQVLVMVCELVLSLRGNWHGRGKWLVRQMRTSDAELTERLMRTHRAALLGSHHAVLSPSDTALLLSGDRRGSSIESPNNGAQRPLRFKSYTDFLAFVRVQCCAWHDEISNGSLFGLTPSL